MHALRSERDVAYEDSVRAQRRVEALTTELLKVKEQRGALEQELNEARTAMQTSAVPGVADLEMARAEVRKLSSEKAQLEKRLANQAKDNDFTRQQYQIASTAAMENASEVQALQAEVAELKVKASGEAARLRELSMQREAQTHLDQVKRLEALLVEREEILRKREDELEHLKKTRGVTTRSASVPKSPRLGSRASSPAPVPGMFANGTAGRGGSSLRYEG